MLPSLARAREERTARGHGGRLRHRAGRRRRCRSSSSRSFAADPLADVLTGDGSEVARDACAEALRWVIRRPSRISSPVSSRARSRHSTTTRTPALGYALGSAAGLAYILTRTDADGIVAVSRGMAVTALRRRCSSRWSRSRGERDAPRCPRRAARPAGEPLHRRLGIFVAAAAIPLSLQLGYVVSIPFAGRLGSGAVTSFGYAYLAGDDARGDHVVLDRPRLVRAAVARSSSRRQPSRGTSSRRRGSRSSSSAPRSAHWRSSGADARRGRSRRRATATEVGDEVARLIVVLSAWIVAAVGVNVDLPARVRRPDACVRCPGSASPRSPRSSSSPGSASSSSSWTGSPSRSPCRRWSCSRRVLAQLGAASAGLRGVALCRGRRRRAHVRCVRATGARHARGGRRSGRPGALLRSRRCRAAARAHGVLVVSPRVALAS